MATKRKADALPEATSGKKAKHTPLMDDSGSEDETGGGADLGGFKVNEEYAKRFEHNKKREELQRLEEKYQKAEKPVKGQYGDKYDEDSESSNDEDEDDDGFLATEALDAEISATLQAIRQKDPRVYDEKITFYAPLKDDEEPTTTEKQKPMFLRDYHRENLLNGDTGVEDEPAPRTFAQEQEDLKRSVVKEMHAVAEGDSDSDEDGGFLVPKAKPVQTTQGLHPSRASKLKLDVASADKDPETFLSNFMSARAWLPGDGARFQPLESDDEEDDERAEEWETAYNLRFEDPKASNEKLKAYSREIVASKSVRREEPNSRRKKRDTLREKKEAEKAEMEEERAQLKRLKVDEMTEKLAKIKKAAGIKGKTLHEDEWTKFLDDGYDDEKWDEEFTKHFDEEYYAEKDAGSDDEGSSKKKAKKPKWDDDLDITDIIPEFVAEEQELKEPGFTLSDDDEAEGDDDSLTPKSKSTKDRQQEKADKKKAARLERKKIEDLVDSRMDLNLPKQSTFRYRETSPMSFGLTARDILMATDTSLNQYAGLKKLATFRESEKKLKDKKRLNKKVRAKWRKENFGGEDEPEVIFAPSEPVAGDEKSNIIEGKKKKRSKKHKTSA